MSYTIAVQGELTGVRSELENQGYHIVDLEHYQGPVSAVVYTDVTGLAELPIADALDGVMSVGEDGLQDVVYIDATGLNEDEVVSIIEGQLGETRISL